MSAQVMETIQVVLDDTDRVAGGARQLVKRDWTGVVKRRVRAQIRAYVAQREQGACHDSAVANTIRNFNCCQEAKSEFKRLMARARRAANNIARREAAKRASAA